MPVREPFFSVVTPTFNRGQFLGKAIESVQAQTISDYEHIIVDDGSVDNTEEPVKEKPRKKYSQKYRYEACPR
jgi:glycosyltransferase involved in cell wall biosynthesis